MFSLKLLKCLFYSRKRGGPRRHNPRSQAGKGGDRRSGQQGERAREEKEVKGSVQPDRQQIHHEDEERTDVRQRGSVTWAETDSRRDAAAEELGWQTEG